MKNTQILVVEDENIVAMEISDRLKQMGYQICKVTSSGESAVEFAQKLTPDLVLMDIMIKGEIDGIEAAAQIRNNFDIPIIYLTAYTDESTLERAKMTEPFGYIIKPFIERELYTTIEMALYKHKMERRLKESEQWLATTLKSISDAVITTDEQGRIRFMNPVAEKLLGKNQTETLGLPLDDILKLRDEKTRESISTPFKKLQATGGLDEVKSSKLVVAADGRERVISASCSPLQTDTGSIKGYVAVFRDITEKQKLENELLKAQKLESIGILAGGIAHDFNNILTAVIGNISLAKVDAQPGEELFDLLKEAEEASLTAKNLTQQLLTFSKGGVPLKKVVSISELIKASTEFALRGSNVTCQFVLPDDLLPVEIDVGQISQVIQNIVINAKQAMPEGGKVEIKTQNVVISPESDMPLEPGKYVELAIKDEGIGIPREILSKIFDPYFTTKSNESGLGLAITYSILKKHGGHIRVESSEGIGTTFQIYLPATSKSIRIKGNVSSKIKHQHGRILLMDDENFIRKIAARMLNRFGFEVKTASNGEEAIEEYQIARQQGKPFDAVILDLTIPGGFGGKETIRRLKEIDPQVTAFVSSGYSNDPIMSEYSKYGFCGVIVKPYKLHELEKALNPLIDRKRNQSNK